MKKLSIELFSDQFLVEPIEEPSRSPGGLELPESVTKSAFKKGKVVAAGPGRDRPLPVKVGDVVLTQDVGTKFPLDGKTYLLLREGDLTAKVL